MPSALSIKAQALAFLLSVQWTTLEGEEQGVRVSDAEVRKDFERFSREYYKSEANQRKYLAERHWVVADVLYQIKRNMIANRLAPKLRAAAEKSGGGEAAYTRLALAHNRTLVSKTSCKPGYVVPGCKEYRQPAVSPPSPSVILEGFAGAVG
jgi:hypothetical protein